MPDLWLPPETRHALWDPDGEQLVVVGWRPGPAGVSAADLSPALRVVLDHASPATLTELVVHAPAGVLGRGEIAIIEAMFGPDVAADLIAFPSSQLAHDRRPLRLDARRVTDDLAQRRGPVDARLAHGIVASDLADDHDLPGVARAFARLEASRAFAELVDVLGRDFVRVHARAGIDEVQGLASDDRVDPVLRHDLIGELMSARGFLQLSDDARVAGQHDELWQRAIDIIGRITRRGPGFRVERARNDDGPAVAASAMPAAAPAAASAAARADGVPRAARAEPPTDQPVEVDGTGGHRGLAWLDPGNNVEISAPASAAGSWARVFRRRDQLLLGLSPLRADGPSGARAVVVIPPDHRAADLVVDLTDHPGDARPSAIQLAIRSAVRAGRNAARLERLDEPDARRAWEECAGRWRDIGDDQRANLALERSRDGRRGLLPRSHGPAPLMQPFVADHLV